MGRAVVRGHAVVLTVLSTGLVAAGLAGCSDDTPGALDSNAADYAAASRVWQDPWVAPTSAMVAGPGLGSNGWVTRIVGGRTTPYDGKVDAVAQAELALAATAGWMPTSSACGRTITIALAGPADAVASLVVRPSDTGAEVRVAALTRHHLDDDWSVPAPVTETCLDGAASDLAQLPEASEPMRTADLPDSESVAWEADVPVADNAALRTEVNADLAAKGLDEIPALRLATGENWRRAPGTELSVQAAGLAGLARTLQGWTLTWAACGGGSPTRATYVRSFDHGPAVAYAVLLGARAVVRFTLPISEGPADDAVAALAPLPDPPCLGTVDELTVAGTPAVLPTELTPIAD